MPTIVAVRQHIAAEVRAEMARQGWKQREAAALVGLDQSSFWLRLRGKRSFRAEELALIAAAFEVPITQFLPAGVLVDPAVAP